MGGEGPHGGNTYFTRVSVHAYKARTYYITPGFIPMVHNTLHVAYIKVSHAIVIKSHNPKDMLS